MKAGSDLDDSSPYDILHTLAGCCSLSSLKAKVIREIKLRGEALPPDPLPAVDSTVELQYDLQQSCELYTPPTRLPAHTEGKHERVQSLGALCHLFDEQDMKPAQSNKESMLKVEESRTVADIDQESSSNHTSFLEEKPASRDSNPLFLGSLGSAILQRDRFQPSDLDEDFPDVQEYREKTIETNPDTVSDYKVPLQNTPPQFAETSWANVPPLSLVEGEFEQEEVSAEEDDLSPGLKFIQYNGGETVDDEDHQPVLMLEPKAAAGRKGLVLTEDEGTQGFHLGSYNSSEFATLYFDSPLLSPARMSLVGSPKAGFTRLASEMGEELDGHGVQAIPESEICVGEEGGRTSTVGIAVVSLEDLEAFDHPADRHHCGVDCLLL